MNNSDLNRKIKTSGTKVVLNTEQYRIEKLQTYDSSLSIGQTYIMNYRSQNGLIFQPICKTFKRAAVLMMQW